MVEPFDLGVISFERAMNRLLAIAGTGPVF
jgi:hypothetical protein